MEIEKTLSKTVGAALGYKGYTAKHGVNTYQQKSIFKQAKNIKMYVFVLEADYSSNVYKKIVFNSYSELQKFVEWAKSIGEDFEHLQKEKIKNISKGKDTSRIVQRLESNLRIRQNEFWDEVRRVSFSINERS